MALTPATGGQDVSAVGTTPIIPGASIAAGTVGSVFSALDPTWSAIVTNLVIKNLILNLRKAAVFGQPDHQALRATHIEGTNQFVYTSFGDLGPAPVLLEGVPPQSVSLPWANFAFGGSQRGNVVAVTDLAAVFSPFDLYSQASEKLAWNAVEAIESSIIDAIFLDALAITGLSAGFAASSIDLVTKMKRAQIPMFSDNTYHGFASPETLAKLMKEAGELGWTDTMKYADSKAILNGEMGTFRGIRWMEAIRSTAANPTAFDGSTDKVVVFGPEAWAQGDYQTIRPYRVTGADHADPLEQRALFGWKGMFGHKAVKMAADVANAPASNLRLVRVATATLA